MGLFDDIDLGQFQDSGGLLGRLLSWSPNASQAGTATDPQTSPLDGASQPQAPADASNVQAPPPGADITTRLGAGLQGWAQTPVGSPFAALANGIKAFNSQPGNDASFIGPPAPPTQTPSFGDRFGAAFQNWAQTPVGSPFAALANGITGFNSGQVIAPAAPSSAEVQTSDSNDQANVAAQNQSPPAANAAMNLPNRRLAVIRKWR